MSAICLAQKEAKSPAGARIKENISSSNIVSLSSIRRDRTTKDAWNNMLSALYGGGGGGAGGEGGGGCLVDKRNVCC